MTGASATTPWLRSMIIRLKMGLLPADGYGGLKVLARLRQGS